MKGSDARSLSHDAQEALRLRVVDAVNKGMKQVEAVRVFGVSRAAVAKWMKQYREGGKRSLNAKRKGRPPAPSRLKGWQAAQIVRAITDKTPDQLKLPFVLWTREAVAKLIEKRFEIRVSLMTVGRWLKRWGLTPQKPKRRAWEQDDARVRDWLEHEYPRVAADAKREKACIHWGDEMGLRSDHQAGTTYGRKGQTPVISGTGKRFGCNMISSVSGRGELRFMVFKKRFTSEVFIEFMRRLIRSVQQKVYLIVDGHPVHKSRKVRQWIESRKEKIRLILLPPYSPDMNPDEFLNHDVKQNAVGRRRATDRDDLIADVRGYLRSTQKQPELVKRYFHAPSVRYAMIE